MSELFNKCLPKWPQLMIVGDRVTTEQAKDIILRTDRFLTDARKYSGGNAREFNQRYREKAGLVEKDSEDWSVLWERQALLRKKLGCLNTNYVSNNWASSAFIGGPHGWCSPKGEIFFQDNVGKWPSVEEIYEDFKLIAEAFPYVKLEATLYDGESCEVCTKPVVSFLVKDGKVEITEEDFKLQSFSSPQSPQDMIGFLLGRDASRELGLPLDWYDDYAAIVKKAIEELDGE